MKSSMIFVQPFSRTAAVRAVLLSLAVTAGTFLFLPLTETFLARRETLKIRELPRTSAAKEPPEKVEPRTETYDTESPVPRMPEETEKRVARVRPEAIDARLSLELRSLSGDFSVPFRLKPRLAGEEFVFEIRDVDTPPVPTVQLPPVYPMHAKMRGIEGVVELVFTVTREGKVEDIRVKRSEPGDTFVPSALRTVKRWKFKPGRKNGKPVNVRVSQPLKYRLDRE